MTPRQCYLFAALFAVLYLKDGSGLLGDLADLFALIAMYGFGRYGVHLQDKAEAEVKS